MEVIYSALTGTMTLGTIRGTEEDPERVRHQQREKTACRVDFQVTQSTEDLFRPNWR